MAKSKQTLNLAFTCLDKFFNCKPSDCVEKPGNTQSTCQNDWSSSGKLDAINSNQEAASSSQARQKDAVLDVSMRRLVASEEDQEHLNFPEDSKSTRRLVASGKSDTKGKGNIWPHHLHTSTDCVLPHMENEAKTWSQSDGSNGKPRCERSFLECIHVRHSSSCSSSWEDFTENLRSTKNQPKKSFRLLFQVTQKLITDQTETTGITTNDWRQPMWTETTLLTDRAVEFATAKTDVFSDSVLCLGGTSTEPVKAWKARL